MHAAKQVDALIEVGDLPNRGSYALIYSAMWRQDGGTVPGD